MKVRLLMGAYFTSSLGLCPASEPLTEECFQRMPLKFDTSRQVLKWNNGSLQYPMGDAAVFVDGESTFPTGSQWARNPVPRIWDSKVGLHNPEVCPGPSTRAAGSPPGCMPFPPPCPWDTYNETGLFPCTPPAEGGLHKCDGDGMTECASNWVVGVVSDFVYIPDDVRSNTSFCSPKSCAHAPCSALERAQLPAGEWVLGWRWDCEETAQVWGNW